MEYQGPARTFQDLQDLIVWQKAHQFVLSVYKITEEVSKLLGAYAKSILSSDT